MVSAACTEDGGNAVIPCVLLFLRDGARTGEHLRELVAAFGFRRQADGLDHTLTLLSADGLVGWWGAEHGRVYELTDAGHQWLAARETVLGEFARLVAGFLARYPAHADVPSGEASTR